MAIKLRRGRRLYSVVIFIFLASGIFLCFQLFSAKILDLHGQDSSLVSKNRKNVEEKFFQKENHIDKVVDDFHERKADVAQIDLPDKNCLVEDCNAHEQKIYEKKRPKTSYKIQ